MHKSDLSVGPEFRWRAIVCASCRNRRNASVPRGAYNQGHQLLKGRPLSVLAVWLALGFLAGIMPGTFDSVLRPWPFGVGGLTVPAHVSSPTKGHLIRFDSALQTAGVATDAASPTDGRPLQDSAPPIMSLCFVMTAGAHLIAQHRAQSGLAPDGPLHVFPPLNLAERGIRSSGATPLLGQCVYWEQPGENRSVCARAGTGHRVPLSARSGV